MGRHKAIAIEMEEAREAYFHDFEDRKKGAGIALDSNGYTTVQLIDPMVDDLMHEKVSASILYRTQEMAERLLALHRSKCDLMHGAWKVEIAEGVEVLAYPPRTRADSETWLRRLYAKANRRLSKRQHLEAAE